MTYQPTAKEIESLHVAFRRAAELLAHGNGPWNVTPNALRAMRDATKEFAKFEAKFSQKNAKMPSDAQFLAALGPCGK
jgi:hypothetical protein